MNDLPPVSFVVLTLNNKKTIRSCIESIISQNYPSFETLVIDGGSSDGTKEIVEEYSDSNVKLYEFVGYGIGKSRQTGVALTTGEICAFIDSDCELPDSYWTKKMVDPFLKYKNLGGTWVLGAYKKDYPSLARYSILQHPYRRKKIPKLISDENYIEIGTGHTLLKKSAILDAGGFLDLKAKEDINLTYKMVKAGYTFFYVENSGVYHLHATTFKGYMKKYERDINVSLNEKEGDSRGSNSRGSTGAISFIISNTLILPTGLALYGVIKDRDLAWSWHPLICTGKLVMVARSFLKLKFVKNRKNSQLQ
ncbi:glycosyltransferase [Methanosarcina sp. T3]|uniref:glycosyltransferase n=1 Tax=Methanosarcina sp. T3 TaxID=3439062 RepID=UPI003F85C225